MSRRTPPVRKLLVLVQLGVLVACTPDRGEGALDGASSSGSVSSSDSVSSSAVGTGGSASVSVGTGGSSSSAGAGACSPSALDELEAEIALLVDKQASDASVNSVADLTLMLERDDGRTFVHSHGLSTPTTLYESASTSKWVTAAVILDLVDQGKLDLTSTVASRLPVIWKESSVTLEHLLSFRSGFAKEPPCLNLANASFSSCVASVYSLNEADAPAPGTQFLYASTHLQVSGLMAVNSVLGASSWGEVFSAFQAKTGLFPNSVYDLPSGENPRLAGGMHWTAEDYQGFLRALYRGKLLTDASRQTMFDNHRGSATVAFSPVLEQLDEDWAYGLGNWLECAEAKGGTPFNCGAGKRNSSPGAYGAYPFIDFERHYFGILARQGPVGTFHEGVATFRAVEGLVAKWAADDCSP